MSNETKRDVFERALRAWEDLIREQELQGEESHGSCEFDQILIKYKKDYDAAFPDDLPVIPKEIGEYIKRQKQGSTLRSAIIAATDFHAVDDEEADWIFYHSDTFARAWLLGAWRVEETGEVVKLEAEK